MTWPRLSALAVALVFLAAVALPAAPVPAVKAGAELEGYLPPDTETVITVNLRQVIDSPLFKKFGLDAAKDALKAAEEVQDILKDLGFDPFKDLDRVVVASPGGKDNDRGLMVAHGRFDVAKWQKKAEQAARDHPDALKVRKVPAGGGGHFVLYEVAVPGQEMTLFVALAGKNTLLASPGKDYVVDALKAGKLKKNPPLKSKGMQALLEKMDAKQSVSFAVLGSALKGGGLDDAPAPIKDLLDKTQALGGGLTLGKDAIQFELAVATDSDKDAKAFKSGVDKGLRQVMAALALLGGARKEVDAALDVVKSIKVSAKGKVVVLKGSVDADTLEGALKPKDD